MIPLVAVVGPTASGKSDVAQRIAATLGGAVLSADSMQIYHGMDIGTGKVPEAERIVEHFGLDLVEPGQPYSVSLYQTYGRRVIDQLAREERPCIICGGTGFYIRALIDDFDFPAGEQVGNPVRDRYHERIVREGAHAVWLELQRSDPASAALINEHDEKRLVRAFELAAEGTSYARQHAAFQTIPAFYDAVFIGLRVDPDILRVRIDRRVDEMVEAGLIAEVEGLLDRGLRDALTAQQAIGYKEIVAFLDGGCTLDDAIERIKIATHRYAKRQRTWFRKDARIVWLDADSSDTERLCSESLELLARIEHEKLSD
jgi:tRNA dimethylallyltransferase